MRFLADCYSPECATTIEGKYVPRELQFELTYLDFLGLRPTMTGVCEACGGSQIFTPECESRKNDSLQLTAALERQDRMKQKMHAVARDLEKVDHPCVPQLREALTAENV